MNTDPMLRTKDEYAAIVEHISVANSPVGIDAQLTHAIIITYLQQILAVGRDRGAVGGWGLADGVSRKRSVRDVGKRRVFALISSSGRELARRPVYADV